MKPVLSIVSLCACVAMAPAVAFGAHHEPAAEATFIDREGQEIGTAKISEDDKGLLMMLDVAIPSGVHAFHIHETGTCTPPDFTSAGGHFNPLDKEHGMHNPKGHHMGDLPNLVAKGPDSYTGKVEAPGLSLHKGDTPVLDDDGAALMIHAAPDDNVSNPSGNAGERIACGVIVSTDKKSHTE